MNAIVILPPPMQDSRLPRSSIRTIEMCSLSRPYTTLCLKTLTEAVLLAVRSKPGNFPQTCRGTLKQSDTAKGEQLVKDALHQFQDPPGNGLLKLHVSFCFSLRFRDYGSNHNM